MNKRMGIAIAIFSTIFFLGSEQADAQFSNNIRIIDEKRLTNEQEHRSGMQFTPEGNKIFYIKKDGIWSLELKEPFEEKIFLNLTDGFVHDFRINSDGKQFVWIKITTIGDIKRTGSSSLLISDLEALSTSELLKFDYWALLGTDWTPDGKEIVYQFGPDVWISNSDGSNKRFITRIDNVAAPLQLGPDGKTILVSTYSSDYPHPQNIVMATLDGRQQILLEGSSVADYWAPVLSPDGSKLLFVQRNSLKDFDIMISEPDGSNKMALISSLDDGSSIDITSDGNKIVYQKDKNIWLATLSQSIPELPLVQIVLTASIIAVLFTGFRR
ncbi:MAG: TolB family protein [Nitrososphaerales archaeon]